MSYRVVVSALFVFLSIPLVSSPTVAADVDAKAAQALAKANGCLACHAVDKTKKGPSYKNVAAKYKGKADGEDRLIQFVTTGPKIKLGGGEEQHPIVETKDPKQLKNLASWILSQ
jgi:cytochrome c